MAKQLFVLEEVLAMLQVVGVRAGEIAKFKTQAEAVLAAKPSKTVDEWSVASGRGQASKRGFVDVTFNDQRSQMEPAKALQIGLWLIQAAEAAISDESVCKLLESIGVTDTQIHGRVLLDLREIRQGTRATVFPS